MSIMGFFFSFFFFFFFYIIIMIIILLVQTEAIGLALPCFASPRLAAIIIIIMPMEVNDQKVEQLIVSSQSFLDMNRSWCCSWIFVAWVESG